MTIAANVKIIQERIIDVCDRIGRDPNEIILMGVTKFVPKEKIAQAYQTGIRYFGESRVKEAVGKFEDFKNEFPDSKLHMIGSLQRNKVKQSLKLFDCIQSVDRMELVDELIKQSCKDSILPEEVPIEVLLELHTGEETKSGFTDLDSLFKAVELILENANRKVVNHKPALRPMGLMTMAPFTTDTDLIRSSFRQVKKAQEELEKRFLLKENWACLSMGMSNDFEIAIEEGSTLLRIGSAIFEDSK